MFLIFVKYDQNVVVLRLQSAFTVERIGLLV